MCPLRHISRAYCFQTETARHSEKINPNDPLIKDVIEPIIGLLNKWRDDKALCNNCSSDLRKKRIRPYSRSAKGDHSAYKARKNHHQKLDHTHKQSYLDKSTMCQQNLFVSTLKHPKSKINDKI